MERRLKRWLLVPVSLLLPMVMTMPGYDMMWFGEDSAGSNLNRDGFLSWTELPENMRENDSSKGFANLTPKEKAMVERVNKVWKEKKSHVWTRWHR